MLCPLSYGGSQPLYQIADELVGRVAWGCNVSKLSLSARDAVARARGAGGAGRDVPESIEAAHLCAFLAPNGALVANPCSCGSSCWNIPQVSGYLQEYRASA